MLIALMCAACVSRWCMCADGVCVMIYYYVLTCGVICDYIHIRSEVCSIYTTRVCQLLAIYNLNDIHDA